MKKFIFFIIVILTIATTDTLAQTFKVIVNKSNEVSSISQKELAMVFLKKRKRWDNGTNITPIDQKPNAKVRETFSIEVFEKKVATIRSYWQKAMFSGMASAPDEKDSDMDVIEYVKNNKGAIGYISANTSLDGVKAVSIVE